MYRLRLASLAGLLVVSMSVPAQQLSLFSDEMRNSVARQQTIVMDFLEHYFGDLLTMPAQTRQTRMADDKVIFRKGHPQDLTHIADTMAFSISLADRHYEVTWAIDDEPFVALAFPAQYDLLLGMSQEEAKNRFRETVIAAPERNVLETAKSNLTRQDDNVYVSKSAFLELESLNDAVYYNKVREGFVPVFDATHKEYAAANLFHGLIANTDYRLYVEQSVYGMKTVSYTVTLSQWLNYCASWGLKTYFAVEEEREDGLLCMVVAQSGELGFNHLLSVIVPDKFVSDRNTVLKARLTPYIPTHNVKNLFQQESNNHKKKQWQ